MKDATTADELGSGCQTIMLFLTDGLPTAGSGPVNGACDTNCVNVITNHVKGKNNGVKKVNIMTYSLSDSAVKTIPHKISCDNDGVWQKVADGADLIGAMTGYFSLLASGMESTTVRWSEP